MRKWRNSSEAYGTVSRMFHWLTALLVFVMLALGWGRDFAPGAWRSVMMDLHKSTGIVILALVVARALWRLYTKPPVLPDTLSRLSKGAAHGVHGLLYLMLAALPLSGWLMLSAMGRGPSLFGLASLPPLMDKAPGLVPLLKNAHGLMAYGLAALVAAHVAAALLHHFFYKDDILRRMLPFSEKRQDASRDAGSIA